MQKSKINKALKSYGKQLDDKRRVSKISACQIYGDLLFSYITKGWTEKSLPLDKMSNQIGYNCVRSKHYITYYIQVTSFYSTIPCNILSSIRDRARMEYGHKVFIDFISQMKPHQVKWKSRTLRGYVDVWRQNKKDNKESKRDADEEGYTSQEQDLTQNRAKWREHSWDYFKYADQNGIPTPLTRIVFRVRIPLEDECYVPLLFEVLDTLFIQYKMYVRPIQMYMYDAVAELSPFKHSSTKLASRLIADRVLSTEVTSSMMPLTQGKLPEGNIILGNDIRNHQLACINTRPKDGGGTNIILIGSTGSGKSALSKHLDTQFIAQHTFNYITDYKNNEYTPLGDRYGATYLDLRGHEGKYYEPLRLPKPTGDVALDATIISDAINGVYTYTSILLGKNLSASQQRILSDCISTVLENHQVDIDNPTTWKNSEQITIHELAPILDGYSFSEVYRGRYGKELVELVDTYHTYFEGIYKWMFQKPISFEELKDAPLIITRFNGADATTASADTTSNTESDKKVATVELRVKQWTDMFLTNELARYRKAHKESFCVKKEELQLYLAHPGSVEWVNTMWTTFRAYNGTCIGIINDPSKLNQNISGLINNTEYIIIGKTEDLNSLDYMFNNVKLAGTKHLVRLLSTKKFCFLLKHNNVKTIFRMELPKTLLESPLYATREEV